MSDVPQGRVAIVRLTTRCMNQCAHCCFECGPKRTDEMSVETAKKVAEVFGPHVVWFNVMGGELTMLRHYPELLHTLAKAAPLRIVTNGWWVRVPKQRDRFVETMHSLVKIQPAINVGVSRDKFHPPNIGEEAADYLRQMGVADDWGLTQADPKRESEAVVPVGRAHWNFIGDGFYSMFGTYCASRKERKSFLVKEDGRVSFCPFGAWTMGTVDWGFETLEEIRQDMDKAFKPSCRMCWQSWLSNKKRIEENVQKLSIKNHAESAVDDPRSRGERQEHADPIAVR